MIIQLDEKSECPKCLELVHTKYQSDSCLWVCRDCYNEPKLEKIDNAVDAAWEKNRWL